MVAGTIGCVPTNSEGRTTLADLKAVEGEFASVANAAISSDACCASSADRVARTARLDATRAPDTRRAGLSAHGQGRAFDFQIEHDGKTVAGFDATQARTQWDMKGWTRKLHATALASGRPFVGPLQSPSEPRHSAYAPIGSQ